MQINIFSLNNLKEILGWYLLGNYFTMYSLKQQQQKQKFDFPVYNNKMNT